MGEAAGMSPEELRAMGQLLMRAGRAFVHVADLREVGDGDGEKEIREEELVPCLRAVEHLLQVEAVQ